jgi:hypothetical protein
MFEGTGLLAQQMSEFGGDADAVIGIRSDRFEGLERRYSSHQRNAICRAARVDLVVLMNEGPTASCSAS